MASTELVIVVFGAVGGANLYFDVLQQFKRDGKLDWQDAVLIKKNSFGDTEIEQTEDPQGGQGARLGALTGALVGLLGGPLGVLIGAAAGAAAGSAAAEGSDIGISEGVLSGVNARMKAENSAFVGLIDADLVDALQKIQKSLEGTEDALFFHQPVDTGAIEKLKRG